MTKGPVPLLHSGHGKMVAGEILKDTELCKTCPPLGSLPKLIPKIIVCISQSRHVHWKLGGGFTGKVSEPENFLVALVATTPAGHSGDTGGGRPPQYVLIPL